MEGCVEPQHSRAALCAGSDSARATSATGDAAESVRGHAIKVLPVAREEHIEDDRDAIEEGDPVLLNGRAAIDIIQNTPELSIVLMDIMMPEMDGYETMREIRNAPEFRTLPILALTAKAMKGDREKCLNAGASDYIAKPVNTDQLLSLMRVWPISSAWNSA